MKTLLWLFALAFNAAFLFVAGATAAAPQVTGLARAMAAVVALGLACTLVLLVAARWRPAGPQAVAALRLACWIVPLAWVAGSLDARLPSLLEAGFLAIAALGAWCSWRVHAMVQPRA